MRYFGLLVLGLFAGFFSASLGIGGGVFVVPGLVLLFGYEIKKSIGTSLAVIAPAALVGVIMHFFIKSSNIKFLVVLFLVAGSIIGASIGVKLVNKLSSIILKRLFALLLVFVGLKLTGVINIPTETASTMAFYPVLIVLGLASGAASALFGIGGGVIMVPALDLFFGLSMHQAIATSLAVILPTSFAGVLFHEKFGNIDTKALKFLVPTALTGAVLGAIVTNCLPSDTLKFIFGILMFVCSAELFLQNRRLRHT